MTVLTTRNAAVRVRLEAPKPVPRPEQPFLQGHCRHKAERGPRAIDAREVPADLARPRGPPFDRDGDAGDGEHPIGEVADGRLVSAADVQDFPAAFALRRRDDRPTDAVD